MVTEYDEVGGKKWAMMMKMIRMTIDHGVSEESDDNGALVTGQDALPMLMDRTQ